MVQCEVLIAGAGPTGLVLALWLTRQGVRVRIVDPAQQPGTTSRALAVQARTLELYQQLDLSAAVLERGCHVPAVSLWVNGQRAAHVDFGEIGAGLSPFSFVEIFPQDAHEALLIERLRAEGVEVERGIELVGFTEGAAGVRVQLRNARGSEEQCEAAYLAGCDGAHSAVRHAIGSGFPGGTYRQLFYVADIEGAGPPFNGELNVDLDEADLLAVFPMSGQGRARLIGTVREERSGEAQGLTFEDVSQRAIQSLHLQVSRVHWFSTYHVYHRVADRFRAGRAFLLGDAGHIHSPAGGQGMNTGIGDAVNLAWKLAAVLQGRAAQGLLDSYERERLPFARRLVATTDRAFSFVSADGPIAQQVRTRLAPLVLAQAVRLEAVREFMFRTISQITLNYRDGPLSSGRAGAVHGGDRLPWAGAAHDNFAPLRDITWQVHLYGTPAAGLREWCAGQGVPLHVFAWDPAHAAVGLARDALYLIRPDSYVAAAEPAADPAVLQAYFRDRQLRAR